MPSRLRRSSRFAVAVVAILFLASSFCEGAITNLNNFVLVNHIASLPNPPGNVDFSGIAYSEQTQSLFIINNGNSSIHEYTVGGAFVRQITSTGFADSEDIVYMGGTQFAIVEEGIRDISILNITPATTSFTKAGSTVIVPTIAGGTFGNEGMEGLAYNSAANVFYALKEKNPLQAYEIQANGTATVLSGVATTLASQMTDLAGAYFDNSPGGSLYAISHESNKIVQLGLDGTLVNTRAQTGEQIEGITFSADGLNMFIIGEDRDFYHYQAVPEPSTLMLAAMGAIGLGIAARRRFGKR